MMWGYGWYSMSWMWIGIVLGIAVIVAAMILLAWWGGHSATPPAPPYDRASALETLAHRYANGEMDEATFERMRTQIQALPDRAADRLGEHERMGV